MQKYHKKPFYQCLNQMMSKGEKMRESYRDKKNRQARINKEKENKKERREVSDRRGEDRRKTHIIKDDEEYKVRRTNPQRRSGEDRRKIVKEEIKEEKEYEDVVYGRGIF